MPEPTEQQKAELEALGQMPDEEIDFSDIPEGPLNPANIRRGMFYIPVKQQATLTLDEYVINWFSEVEPDEKARDEAINRVLIAYIKDRESQTKENVASQMSGR